MTVNSLASLSFATRMINLQQFRTGILRVFCILIPVLALSLPASAEDVKSSTEKKLETQRKSFQDANRAKHGQSTGATTTQPNSSLSGRKAGKEQQE